MSTLRGIAWNHTRGLAPLAVTAQVFADLHPETEIVWEPRSLRDFGEGRLDDLAEVYDLLVIDHPMVGFAARKELLLRLDEHVLPAWLQQAEKESAGASHSSYTYGCHQWAVAIDAACQVAASRQELMRRADVTPPVTWEEVVNLARRTRKVALPLAPIDALSCFFTLCANQGAPPLQGGEAIVERETGASSLERLRELAALVDDSCLALNPIELLNWMAIGSEIMYCPLTYGYTNYSREGYASSRLTFHDIPAAGDLGCAGSTLGGAGLAVSSRCGAIDEAVAYLQWVAGAECQRTTYLLAGGQPGNIVAWEDDLANELTGHFFRNTLQTLERAYVRPTSYGMAEFQHKASLVVHDFVRGRSEVAIVLDRLDTLYAEHLDSREIDSDPPR